MKLIKNEKMKQLLQARSMILVTNVQENGLPRPGTGAQKMREYYADLYLPKPLEKKTRAEARLDTQENLRIGEAKMFSGKKFLHMELMKVCCRRKRNVNRTETPASQALAIVQEGAFLRLNRMVFEVPIGLTTFEAVQQAKQEISDASIQLLTAVKFRNYLRRVSQYEVANKSTLITARKLVRKAMPSWKRAAYNRVRQIIPDGVERRRKTRAIMNASAKPWTIDEDRKGFRRDMKKDGKRAAEPLYLLKKSIVRKKRQDKRRKVLKQLQHVDQIAANRTCSL